MRSTAVQGPQKTQGELRQRTVALPSCPRALMPKVPSLASTHGTCKHFLASFAFSHPTTEPPVGYQVNFPLPVG